MRNLSRLILAAFLLVAANGQSLLDAVRNSDRAAVQALLAKKVDVNAAQADGTTALHWAAYRDDLASADLLLKAGATVNAVTDVGITPLWNAAVNGSAEMTKVLLAAGADPNIAQSSGETPLMAAARTGNPDVVEQLLAKGANPDAQGTRKQTALMWAVSENHPEAVKVLLAHKANVQLRSEVWSMVMAVPPHGELSLNKAIPHGGETALMFAARDGDLESAKLLVAAGANVNDTDAWGVSATTLAAHSGFTDLVEFLLQKDANPNLDGAGFTALQVAIMRRDERMVKALLDHGADANAPLKTWTPTRRSSDDYHFDPAWVGTSPLWLAARFPQPGVMRLLIEHGADSLFVHHADWIASAGFGAAHRKENATTLLAALGAGSGVSWFDPPAAQREALALEAVKMLVEKGVDVNAKTDAGRTALDLAKGLRYNTVAAYLTEKGGIEGVPAPAGGRGGRAGGRGGR